MNKILNSVMMIVGIVAIIAAILWGSLWYKTHYEAAVVDTVLSPDGTYELILQSVGEPYFPFGATPGRLVLKNGETVAAKADFEIANDGASLSTRDWSVTWYEDHVEIILSGKEQYDERVTLYDDGQVERSRLATHYGVEKESVSGDIGEDAGSETYQQVTGES